MADEIIHEDDPRWDCHTMGNQVCGPTTEIGEPAPIPQLPETGAATGAFAAVGSLLLLVGIGMSYVSRSTR